MFALSPTLQAQRAAGDIGIGLQIGEPSGLSVGYYQSDGVGVDVLAAWDLDDYLYVNAHALYTRPINELNELDLYFFFGPGAFVGLQENRNDWGFRAGISGTAGISLMISSFEIYFRLTPRLRLIDETRADIGGGLGLRWWF